jgi:dihydrofolate reductase
MADLIVSEFVSLNGVMEAPGGEPTHPHAGWTFKSIYGDDHYGYKGAELEEAERLLLGRKTYEGFAAAWPQRDPSDPFTAKINAMPKFVVSSTLRDPEWENTTVLEGDPIEAVATLKQSGGPIMVNGSAQLVHALARAGLVDEYRAMVHPVLVAGGLRMFPDPDDMLKLELIEAKAYDSGVALLIYRPADRSD